MWTCFLEIYYLWWKCTLKTWSNAVEKLTYANFVGDFFADKKVFCYIARLSVNKMSSVIGWFLVTCPWSNSNVSPPGYNCAVVACTPSLFLCFCYMKVQIYNKRLNVWSLGKLVSFVFPRDHTLSVYCFWFDYLNRVSYRNWLIEVYLRALSKHNEASVKLLLRGSCWPC